MKTTTTDRTKFALKAALFAFVVILCLLAVAGGVIFHHLNAIDRTDVELATLNKFTTDVEQMNGAYYAYESSLLALVREPTAINMELYKESREGLRTQTADLHNPDYEGINEDLVQLLSAKIDIVVELFDRAVALVETNGERSAEQFINSDRVTNHKSDIVRLLKRIDLDTSNKLRRSREDSAVSTADLRTRFALIFAFVMLITIASFVLYFKYTNQRIAETQLAERKAWLESGKAEFLSSTAGESASALLGQSMLSFLSKYLGHELGSIYTVSDSGKSLSKLSTFGVSDAETCPDEIGFGEGLMGQAAIDREFRHYKNIRGKFFGKVKSSMGADDPAELLVVPVCFENELEAVLEFGAIGVFREEQVEFIKSLIPELGTVLHSARSRKRLKELLSKTRTQAEELQAQQEELRVANEELGQQAQLLEESKQRMESQHKQLQESNVKLEEEQLEVNRQKDKLERFNDQLLNAHQVIKEKALEAEKASNFKSEFLANMSHELRTPLNSIMILSNLLEEDTDNSLSSKQRDYAKTIHSAGSDLLVLIDDILDLAKIESGKNELEVAPVNLQALTEKLKKTFKPVAEGKALNFDIKLDANLPRLLQTDAQKVEQILKNFLSNACKFTDRGSVSLRAEMVEANDDAQTEPMIKLSVKDSGIGIAKDKQATVFEAFRQADGTTVRKYGGTGLGLSISSKLAEILGGEITLDSVEDQGSTFTLWLPLTPPEATPEKAASGKAKLSLSHWGLSNAQIKSADTMDSQVNAAKNSDSVEVEEDPVQPDAPRSSEYHDDRDHLSEGDKVVLVIEDDAKFANILYTLATTSGYKCLMAENGEFGLQDASTYLPDAVVLDLNLPGIKGLEVLERLKDGSKTRHIPVHVISAEGDIRSVRHLGAVGFFEKPVDRNRLADMFEKFTKMGAGSPKKVLIVEDNKQQQMALTQLINQTGSRTEVVATAKEALKKIEDGSFDCIVMDLVLPDSSGFQLLQWMSEDAEREYPPVIIYTGKDLSRAEEEVLLRYSESIIIKGARSPERLLDQVTLFLHHVEKDLPFKSQELLAASRKQSSPVKGRKILLVDDDMRNVFALSQVLESKGAAVQVARNGLEALEATKQAFSSSDKQIDLVLMDIMMPEMDGYEATRNIRMIPQAKSLPIIALTAKAMKDDGKKCLDAGASDYLPKPVDIPRLLSLLKVWLEPKSIYED